MTVDPHDTDGIDAQVASWALDEEIDDAVRVRRRSRRLAGLTREEDRFRDVLEAFSQRGAIVEISTSAARTHLGRIEMVADDHIRFRSSRGAGLIAITAVIHVSERAGRMSDIDRDLGPEPSAELWQHAPRRLLHALERLTGTEVVMRLATGAGPVEKIGEVESVGEDFALLRTETGTRPERVYARLEAVAEAWPFMSG